MLWQKVVGEAKLISSAQCIQCISYKIASWAYETQLSLVSTQKDAQWTEYNFFCNIFRSMKGSVLTNLYFCVSLCLFIKRWYFFAVFLPLFLTQPVFFSFWLQLQVQNIRGAAECLNESRKLSALRNPSALFLMTDLNATVLWELLCCGLSVFWPPPLTKQISTLGWFTLSLAGTA